jgi:hypothetical protein
MANEKKKTQKEVATEKADRIMDGIATWCSFYRANPHRFCKDYLNITLKLFQQILLYMMFVSNYFMYIASRGSGKTFLVAIFCTCRCILYPDTNICVASKNRKQANEVLEKITNILMPNSDNLKLEIEKSNVGQNEAYIKFRNGSLIKVVTANDNARHSRANILVIDEFRMVDKKIVDAVLRKFLTAPRHPKYLDKPEYAHLEERNKEFYMSSAWFKFHWSYEKLKAFCANIVNDTKKYFVCGLPYQLAIKERLLSAEQVADEMTEADFDSLMWDMEMGCMWHGDDDGAFFTYEDITQNRKCKRAIFMENILGNIADKTFKIPDLAVNERRILSVDVALLASTKHKNDASSIFINSALPTGKNTYQGNLIYTENFEGINTDDLALIVRRYFHYYKCTDIALDVRGLGLGVYDCLIKEMYDPLTGDVYEPLNCIDDPIYAERCKYPDAKKVIWAIKATDEFNHFMSIALRNAFKQGKINLLVHEVEAEEFLKDIKGYKSMSATEKARILLPYINTTLAVSEMISLEKNPNGKYIKLQEKSGRRKDRFSSLGYNYWIQSYYERKLVKPKELTEIPKCVSSISF